MHIWWNCSVAGQMPLTEMPQCDSCLCAAAFWSWVWSRGNFHRLHEEGMHSNLLSAMTATNHLFLQTLLAVQIKVTFSVLFLYPIKMGTNKCASQAGMTAYGTRRHLYDPKMQTDKPFDQTTISLQMGTNKGASQVSMRADTALHLG